MSAKTEIDFGLSSTLLMYVEFDRDALNKNVSFWFLFEVIFICFSAPKTFPPCFVLKAPPPSIKMSSVVVVCTIKPVTSPLMFG